MTNTELLQYLEIIIDVETDMYLKNELIKFLNNEKIDNPSPPTVPIPPNKPDYQNIGAGHKESPISMGIMVIAVIVIISKFVSWCNAIVGTMEFPWDSIILTIVGSFVLIVIVESITFYCEKQVKKKQLDEQYQRQMVSYRKSFEKYIKASYEYKNRIEIKNRFIVMQLNKIYSSKKKTQDVLFDLYSKGPVYYKYRRLPMISSIYEYLKSGRCSELEGANGAYNILEMEMRMNYIVIQMNQIIVSLDAIYENQRELYFAIMGVNMRLNDMQSSVVQLETSVDSIKSISKLKKNNNLQRQTQQIADSLDNKCAITSYLSQRAYKEQEYINKVNCLTGGHGI